MSIWNDLLFIGGHIATREGLAALESAGRVADDAEALDRGSPQRSVRATDPRDNRPMPAQPAAR